MKPKQIFGPRRKKKKNNIFLLVRSDVDKILSHSDYYSLLVLRNKITLSKYYKRLLLDPMIHANKDAAKSRHEYENTSGLMNRISK